MAWRRKQEVLRRCVNLQLTRGVAVKIPTALIKWLKKAVQRTR